MGNLPFERGTTSPKGLANTAYVPRDSGSLEGKLGQQDPALEDEPASHQLVGGVMAYQGEDG